MVQNKHCDPVLKVDEKDVNRHLIWGTFLVDETINDRNQKATEIISQISYLLCKQYCLGDCAQSSNIYKFHPDKC